MHRFLNRLTLAVALATAVAITVAPLALVAQARPASSDARALAGYRLTMADVRKYGATMQELGKAIRATPALEDRFTGTMDESIDETAARLAGVPQFRPAFARTGMSPKQFAVTQFVIVGAGMAVGVPKGPKSPEQLVKEMGIDPANVAFMRAHGAEIRAMFKQIGGNADDDAQF